MRPKVGLVECQSVALFTEDGQSLSSITNRRALVSKLVLIPLVESAGFDVDFINLKSSDNAIRLKSCHGVAGL